MDELRKWRDLDGSYGLAVVGGAISGGQYGFGLEIIDIDTATLAGPWMELVEQRVPGLVKRLVRVQTPRPGLHTYYRCSRFGTSQKLAFAPEMDDFGQPAFDSQGNPGRKTLIEVKAEGGYCLIPPSPPRCHPSGRLYQYAEGSADLTAVPVITPDERNILLEAARSLSQWQPPKATAVERKRFPRPFDPNLPGHDFNARAKWTDILPEHGWSIAGQYGEETRWCRPGKDSGTSAVTNHNGCDLLHVFTSEGDPFEMEKNYCKFTAFCLLNHDGDFKAAARALHDKGYGSGRFKSGKR